MQKLKKVIPINKFLGIQNPTQKHGERVRRWQFVVPSGNYQPIVSGVFDYTVVFKAIGPGAWGSGGGKFCSLLEMIEILAQFHVVELGEKPGVSGSVELKYSINKFALGHSSCLNIIPMAPPAAFRGPVLIFIIVREHRAALMAFYRGNVATTAIVLHSSKNNAGTANIILSANVNRSPQELTPTAS